jgi:hypothetical protein
MEESPTYRGADPGRSFVRQVVAVHTDWAVTAGGRGDDWMSAATEEVAESPFP